MIRCRTISGSLLAADDGPSADRHLIDTIKWYSHLELPSKTRAAVFGECNQVLQYLIRQSKDAVKPFAETNSFNEVLGVIKEKYDFSEEFRKIFRRSGCEAKEDHDRQVYPMWLVSRIKEGEKSLQPQLAEWYEQHSHICSCPVHHNQSLCALTHQKDNAHNEELLPWVHMLQNILEDEWIGCDEIQSPQSAAQLVDEAFQATQELDTWAQLGRCWEAHAHWGAQFSERRPITSTTAGSIDTARINARHNIETLRDWWKEVVKCYREYEKQVKEFICCNDTADKFENWLCCYRAAPSDRPFFRKEVLPLLMHRWAETLLRMGQAENDVVGVEERIAYLKQCINVAQDVERVIKLTSEPQTDQSA